MDFLDPPLQFPRGLYSQFLVLFLFSDYTAYRITSTTASPTTSHHSYNVTGNRGHVARTQFSKKNSIGKSVVGVVNDSPTPTSTQRSDPIAPGKTLSAPPISQQSGMTGLCSGSLMPICRCFSSVLFPALGRLVYVTVTNLG